MHIDFITSSGQGRPSELVAFSSVLEVNTTCMWYVIEDDAEYTPVSGIVHGFDKRSTGHCGLVVTGTQLLSYNEWLPIVVHSVLAWQQRL